MPVGAPSLVVSSIRDFVQVRLGIVSPPLLDQIVYGGAPQDMTGATGVQFSMRPLVSRQPTVNGASATAMAPPDGFGNNIAYQWQVSDISVEGQYMGWWRFALPGDVSPRETNEFPILISDHGPGHGFATGVVVDGVAQYMPVTFIALRDDPNFGARFLQRHADRVKRVVMGAVVSPDAEQTYDPLLVDYLSKRTALELITPARDYWARQRRTATTQNPTEVSAYPDMLSSLDKLSARLCQELDEDWRQLQFIVTGLPQRHVSPSPASSLGDPSDPRNLPTTRDPQTVLPLQTGRSALLPFRFSGGTWR